MRLAEAVARSKGLDTVALYTPEGIGALAFLRALGFVETGRRVEDGSARA
jgi:ribosomal protein S18 acetylase RimI-like enzyme